MVPFRGCGVSSNQRKENLYVPLYCGCHCGRCGSRHMVKRQGLNIASLCGCLVLMLGMRTQALAVWPPSTAFQEQPTSLVYGFVVIVFVVGIAIGVYVQK